MFVIANCLSMFWQYTKIIYVDFFWNVHTKVICANCHWLSLSAVCREGPRKRGSWGTRKSNRSRRKDQFNQKPPSIPELQYSCFKIGLSRVSTSLPTPRISTHTFKCCGQLWLVISRHMVL